MKKNPGADHKFHPHAALPPPPADHGSVPLGLAEQELSVWTDALARGVLHYVDRSTEEELVLRFLAQALDPSAAGIAAQTGLSPDQTNEALAALTGPPKLIWSQTVSGTEPGWHLSTEGHRYLAERGLLPPKLQHP